MRGREVRGAGAATVVAAIAVTLAAAYARQARENVHRPDADCAGCHTADRATLERDPAAARTALVPDVEARCNACHSDEGPSHRTGMPPKRPVPPPLPLSADGLITCATCHFVHGEKNPFGDFVRIDNSRGGLCLTCHDLSELQ